VDIAYSINEVPIRLTEERWEHIISNKPYMESYYGDVLEAIENPTWILRGYAGSLIAVLSIAKLKYLHVVYKEVSINDGFIITAYVSRKVNKGMIMGKEILEEKSIGFILKAIPQLIQIPKTCMWLDYDSEADVLYIHFEEKPNSNHSEMREDGIMLDYKDNNLVGLTILEASQR